MSDIKKSNILPTDSPSASKTYELDMGSRSNVVINYDFTRNADNTVNSNPIPCRIRIKEGSNFVFDTGFRGDSSYNSVLQSLGFPAIVSSVASDSFDYFRQNLNEKVFIVIDSPLVGSRWKFEIGCDQIENNLVCVNRNLDSDFTGANYNQSFVVYGPETIECGDEFLAGGLKRIFPCGDVIRLYGKDNDSDSEYCEDCLSSNIVSVLPGGNNGGGDGGGDDSDSDSDINVLFDKSSWTTIPMPYREYLDEAADRWNKFLRINKDVIQYATSFANSNLEPNWNGIKLASQQSVNANVPGRDPFEYTNDNTIIASCGPILYLNIKNKSSNYGGILEKPHISLNFRLTLNQNSTISGVALSRQQWVDVLTHELGHALGFGIFWNKLESSDDSDSGDIQPMVMPDSILGHPTPDANLLDGNIFKNALDAYKSMVFDPSLTKIPLEASIDPLVNDIHWSSTSINVDGKNHPGVVNEVGSAYINQKEITISRLSIKTLVDIGYEEINPGAQEASPDLSN